MSVSSLSITNRTRRAAPRALFAKAARAVLPGWDISVALVGPAEAKRLNQKFRGKTYEPNVLSYQAGERSGEVILCPEIARREAPRYGHTPSAHLLFLFIHGLLHLKGMRHSATMEERERMLLAKFALNDSTKESSGDRRNAGIAKVGARTPLQNGSTHRNRNRHRHLPGKTGGRRRAR